MGTPAIFSPLYFFPYFSGLSLILGGVGGGGVDKDAPFTAEHPSLLSTLSSYRLTDLALSSPDVLWVVVVSVPLLEWEKIVKCAQSAEKSLRCVHVKQAHTIIPNPGSFHK